MLKEANRLCRSKFVFQSLLSSDTDVFIDEARGRLAKLYEVDDLLEKHTGEADDSNGPRDRRALCTELVGII